MNERILEFAQRAGLISHFNVAPHRPDIERFAKLIVRECLTFVEPMPGSGDIVDLALEAAREGIKEHFGVES